MNQKKLKKLRRKLREERAENAPPAVVSVPVKPMKPNLLMRRKDLKQENHQRSYQGGAILHPLSERAMYQFAKKKGLGG